MRTATAAAACASWASVLRLWPVSNRTVLRRAHWPASRPRAHLASRLFLAMVVEARSCLNRPKKQLASDESLRDRWLSASLVIDRTSLALRGDRRRPRSSLDRV